MYSFICTYIVLDERYIESIFKGVPQLALQLYIVFYTAINSNVYSLVVLFSAGLSLVTLASVLCLLYDRKVFRLASMAPAENNPLIVRYLAKFLSVFGLGVDDESVKELTNFYSFWVAHYIFSLIYYLMLLSVRAIAVTWLGALTGKSNFIVFLVVFGTRICCIYMLDCADRATTRPWFRTLVLALSLCVTDSAWVKEEEYPIESRNGFRVLATLTTVENIVFISYSLNVCLEEGSLPNIISVPLFGACMTAIMVRWLLIDYWLLPIHYPELQDNNDADEDTTDEDRVVSHKNDMEMIRLLAQTESGDPSQKKQGVNRRLSSLLNDQGKFSNLFSSSTAAAPIKIGWQPSRKKGFYDMRRKQQDASEGGRMGGIMKTIQNSTRNFRMAMEGEKGEESKVEKMTAVAEGNENEPDSDDEYEVAESDAALGRTRTQSGNSVGSRKTPESPETISTKPVHNPNVDRLLHIGVLEKSGPSTMIWYPWLSRLVMFTTKSVKYFSIPYVEHSEGRKGARKSVSKGFKAPQSARGSISSEEMRVQGLINSDIEELLEFRMSMMQLNDCGLVMVGRILHDKGYKLKGEIKFSAVLGVTVDVNKKVLHVDFATATRVFHFRTQKLSEKGAIDTALTIVASQLHGECEFTDEVEEHNPEILTGVVDSVGPKNDNSVRESSASLFRITYTDAARESNDIGYGALSNGAKPSRAKSIKPFEPICEDDVQDTADIELSMMEQARKRQSKRPSVAPVSISDDQLISQTETERLIQLAHDMSPPSPRLLYIGMLEKTGGSLFSSGWLTRLVIVSTQCVEYFSIPYVESAGGLDLAKEADKQKAIQDYTECTQLRAAMIRYPESGYQLVKSLLEDRNYKKKGEIPFAVIDGYSAQINNKNVLIFDIPTKQK